MKYITKEILSSWFPIPSRLFYDSIGENTLEISESEIKTLTDVEFGPHNSTIGSGDFSRLIEHLVENEYLRNSADDVADGVPFTINEITEVLEIARISLDRDDIREDIAESMDLSDEHIKELMVRIHLHLNNT